MASAFLFVQRYWKPATGTVEGVGSDPRSNICRNLAVGTPYHGGLDSLLKGCCSCHPHHIVPLNGHSHPASWTVKSIRSYWCCYVDGGLAAHTPDHDRSGSRKPSWCGRRWPPCPRSPWRSSFCPVNKIVFVDGEPHLTVRTFESVGAF